MSQAGSPSETAPANPVTSPDGIELSVIKPEEAKPESESEGYTDDEEEMAITVTRPDGKQETASPEDGSERHSRTRALPAPAPPTQGMILRSASQGSFGQAGANALQEKSGLHYKLAALQAGSTVSLDTADLTDTESDAAELNLEDLPPRANLVSGLTDQDVAILRQEHGFNEVLERKENPIKKFLMLFWGPIPIMIMVSAGLSGGVQSWPDFGIILGLLFLNAIVRFVEERNAGNAIAALQSSLAVSAKATRNGTKVTVPARELVPGDLIYVKLGDIIPADSILVGPSGHELIIDQSALTGESLTVTKGVGDTAYSGSICRSGEMEAIVNKTGAKTFFGKSAELINSVQNVGHVQVVLFRLGVFLIVLAFCGVVIVLVVGISRNQTVLQIVDFCSLIVIASIPVAMPTVLSVTMALGAHRLSRLDVIVSKMSAVEELAGMDILCSDKTGTLTKNQLTVDEPVPFKGFTNHAVLHYAALASKADSDAIDTAILNSVTEPELLAAYKLEHFQPFDPKSKRTEVDLTDPDGRALKVSKGSPQVILALCKNAMLPVKFASLERKFNRIVDGFASRGFRAIAVARTRTQSLDIWAPIGVIPLFDPPRDDAAHTIVQLHGLGVDVKMITGDQTAIARETASRLGLNTNIFDASIFGHREEGSGSAPAPATGANATPSISVLADVGEIVERCSGFAQVFPEHKFQAVELLQKRGHIVAMTGDGVNDAPALKKADVGFAVQGATDAARSAASVVLLQPGLNTIVAAIQESRRIFNRMKSYVIYQVHSTVQVLTFLVLAVLIYDWYLLGIQIVLLAVINDGTTLTIAVDRVKYHNEPEKWDLLQLVILATSIGLTSVGAAFIVLFIWKDVLPVPLEMQQTLLYMQLAVSGQLTIFLSRTKGLFFLSIPCWQLVVAVIGAQLIALFFSVYGILMPAIGWWHAGVAWGFAVLSLLVKELIKLGMIRLLKGINMLVVGGPTHSRDALAPAVLLGASGQVTSVANPTPSAIPAPPSTRKTRH